MPKRRRSHATITSLTEELFFLRHIILISALVVIVVVVAIVDATNDTKVNESKIYTSNRQNGRLGAAHATHLSNRRLSRKTLASAGVQISESHGSPSEHLPAGRSPFEGHLATNIATNMTTKALVRAKRQPTLGDERDKLCLGAQNAGAAVLALRCDQDCEVHEKMIVVRANSATELMIFGRRLDGNLSIALTPSAGQPNDDCTHTDRIRTLQVSNNTFNMAQIIVDIPSPGADVPLYLCLRDSSAQHDGWFHQGSEPWMVLYVHQDMLPTYAKIIVIFVLLMLSGLFSGLNLGLMALDKNELQVIIACGNETEKRYARTIEPVRRRGNQLLCSILFTNTLINSTIAVLMEELSSGFVAVISSTILIVMVGEIFPQAFCSRHGLAVGAKTVSLTYFCMAVTFPLAYPVAVCLDWALGEEIGHAYDRERLMEFIRVTREYNNLETDEVNIISGALNLKRIHLSEIMTRIDDVFMLDETAVLDFNTIQMISEKGYSRIPVHEEANKKNIIALLLTKDLALIDPDDKVPVQTMIRTYTHPMMFLFEDTKLDQALNEFKTGKSHMAFIKRVIDDGDRDPVYEIIGVVTLEDVIEEIIQMEINDETDTLTDNRRKRRRQEAQVRKDFSHFTKLGRGDSSHTLVTPQLALAAYQHLSTNVEPFSQKLISDAILKRLLSQKIYYKVRLDDGDSDRYLYSAGEPADYFIMILEGRVHARCGREQLLFVGGPFSLFGKAALSAADPQAPVSRPFSQTLVAGAGTGSGALQRKESTCRLLAPGSGGGGGSIERRESFVLTNKQQACGENLQLPTSNSTCPSDKSSSIALEASQQATETPSACHLLSVAALGPPAGSSCLLRQSESRASLHSMEKSLAALFVPDYSVEVVADTCFMKISRADYLTALRATVVERGAEDESNTNSISINNNNNNESNSNIIIGNQNDYLTSIPQLGGSIKDNQ